MRGCLARLHGFHVPLEATLFAAAATMLPELDDLSRRRKAHLLDADLAVLATMPSAAAPVPAVDSAAAVLGTLYVIEGATLGGRMLGRGVVPVLAAAGVQAPDGCRFLLAYEPLQGAMWRRFVAVLDDVAGGFTAEAQQAMAAAAYATFLRLESWLSA